MSLETEIGVFVEGVLNYFSTAVQQGAQCGTPHLALNDKPDLADYTGVIQVSGKRTGLVAFTAPKSMLSVMLMRMQETDMSHENLSDLAGEIANTLAGNARREFGHQFQISVPVMHPDRASPLPYSPASRPMVIPIDWRNYHARLIVCLE
ncbi:MAG TPA: chemotaxis protein CheX [Steroidobacteraceae bacterium]